MSSSMSTVVPTARRAFSRVCPAQLAAPLRAAAAAAAPAAVSSPRAHFHSGRHHLASTVAGPPPSATQTFRQSRRSAAAAAAAAANVFQQAGGRRTIFIQTQDTPNQDALKFLPSGQRVLPEGFGAPFVEYLSPRSTLAAPHPSPLAAQLLAVDGVSAVFYGPDHITVTKAADVPWAHVKPEVFALITEALTAGQPLVNTTTSSSSATAGSGAQDEQTGTGRDSLEHDENDDEVVQMIKELLETRIRPAIREDGGDIDYRGFEDGKVLLKLRGACRTCDSSTVTLRNGIENMLTHYIEEVKGVTQILDEEEEIALKEFAKFEEKLKAQKGEAAVAGTGGKGSLDTAEA